MKATEAELEALILQHRSELRAHCYRMLGSIHDADDALQDALLGAWRGLAGFEGRSTLRAWLYRCATNACIHLIAKRPKRIFAYDARKATDGVDVDRMITEPIWLEPCPSDIVTTYEQRESIELAFVASLQHLPATQRAALLLHEALGFEASEIATMLDTSVPAINSALQRARKTVAERVPPETQQATLRDLGESAVAEIVASYIDAWGRADVGALVALLAKDARFTMPPIPTWFDGRDAVARFFAERVFATPWRLVATQANGQLAFACYQGPDFRLGALNVITLRGREIAEMTGFLDPAVHKIFRLQER